MEEKFITINRNSLNSAIPVGGAIILLLILYYVFDLDVQGFWGYFTYAVLLGGIIWGTYQLREKHRGGILTYGQSLSSGVLIGLYTGIINGIYNFVFYKFFAPEEINVLLGKIEEQMLEKAPQMTDQELDVAMSMTAKFMTPFGMAVGAIFYMVFAAFILSLIASIFLKRDNGKSIEE